MSAVFPFTEYHSWYRFRSEGVSPKGQPNWGWVWGQCFCHPRRRPLQPDRGLHPIDTGRPSFSGAYRRLPDPAPYRRCYSIHVAGSGHYLSESYLLDRSCSHSRIVGRNYRCSSCCQSWSPSYGQESNLKQHSRQPRT